VTDWIHTLVLMVDSSKPLTLVCMKVVVTMARPSDGFFWYEAIKSVAVTSSARER